MAEGGGGLFYEVEGGDGDGGYGWGGEEGEVGGLDGELVQRRMMLCFSLSLFLVRLGGN